MSDRFVRQVTPIDVDVQPLHTDKRQPDRYRIFVTVAYDMTGTRVEADDAGHELRRKVAAALGAAA